MAQKNDGLQLSRRSRAGALLLLGILIVLAVTWRLLPLLRPPVKDAGEKDLQEAWEVFRKENVTEEKQQSPRYASSSYDDPGGSKPSVPVHMAPFDPNTAGAEQLLALGLSERTVRTWIKYRSKGGRFRSREDLQKLYTLDKKDYERIAPLVKIQGSSNTPEAFTTGPPVRYEEQAPEIVELNSADADALMALRGIGPGYSRRILSFRDALGGFFRVEQLQEVYGFPDSTYQQLKDHFKVDPARVRLININTATEEELAHHPYIGKKLAGNIIKLRNDLKSFSEIVQIRQAPLINEEKYRKIAPYLSTH